MNYLINNKILSVEKDKGFLVFNGVKVKLAFIYMLLYYGKNLSTKDVHYLEATGLCEFGLVDYAVVHGDFILVDGKNKKLLEKIFNELKAN